MPRGKLVALTTGAISLLLAIAYLLLVLWLDARSFTPAPIVECVPVAPWFS